MMDRTGSRIPFRRYAARLPFPAKANASGARGAGLPQHWALLISFVNIRLYSWGVMSLALAGA